MIFVCVCVSLNVHHWGHGGSAAHREESASICGSSLEESLGPGESGSSQDGTQSLVLREPGAYWPLKVDLTVGFGKS